MTADDKRMADQLMAAGVDPSTIRRLAGYAEADGESLRELVRYILGDYVPAYLVEPGGDGGV